MIVIIDYGMGNLRSVEKAFEHLGFAAKISSDAKEIARGDKLILPGDGAFGAAMQNLRAKHFDEWILEAHDKRKPVLGLCVGLQVLFSESEEFGTHPGLNIFPGKIRRFSDKLTVPHMGWNQVRLTKLDHPLLRGIVDESYFYFVHSYYLAECDQEKVLGWTTYGGEFPSIIGNGSLWATQFHPEKSQTPGLQLLKNFAQF